MLISLIESNSYESFPNEMRNQSSCFISLFDNLARATLSQIFKAAMEHVYFYWCRLRLPNCWYLYFQLDSFIECKAFGWKLVLPIISNRLLIVCLVSELSRNNGLHANDSYSSSELVVISNDCPRPFIFVWKRQSIELWLSNSVDALSLHAQSICSHWFCLYNSRNRRNNTINAPINT